MLAAALAVTAILTPSGLSEQDLVDGLRYREQLLGPIELHYTLETRFDPEGVEIYGRYKGFIAERIGEPASARPLNTEGSTVAFAYLSDGLRFRLSGFSVGADAQELWRLAYDGKLFRTFAPSTRTGQILPTYASTHEDPFELGFTVEGRSLAEILAASRIDAVREVDLDGTACLLVEASRPEHAREGIDEARRLVRVWIDPRRGFAVLRGEFGGEIRQGSTWTREMPSTFFAVHRLEEIGPGLWFPMSGVVSRNIQRYSASMQMETAAADGGEQVELARFFDKSVEVASARLVDPPAEALAIGWPTGTQVLDTVTNKLLLVGNLEDELHAASLRLKPEPTGAEDGSPASQPAPALRPLSLEQLDPDRDCGLRALYMALAYLDLHPDWQRLTELTEAEREDGVSLRLLRETAEGLGAHTLGLRLDSLSRLPEDTPVIVFLRGEPSVVKSGGHRHAGVGHFLLALKRPGEPVKLYDPLESQGGAAVTPDQLAGFWSGEVLELARHPLEPPARRATLPWIAALLGLALAGALWLQRGLRRRRAAGALMLAVALAVPASIARAQNAAPGDAPSIAFDETSVDLGRRGAYSGIVRHQFHYRNAGTRDLEISYVQSSCECTAVWDSNHPVVVPPGESRTLTVEVDPSGRFGRQKALVAVHSNDPVNPVVDLQISLVIEQEVSVLPDRIDSPPIGPGAALASELEVHLLVDAARPGTDVERVDTHPSWIHAELEAAPDPERTPEQERRGAGLRERVWTVHLSGAPPAETPPGPLHGMVTVVFAEVSGLMPVKVPVSAEIVGRAFATPDRILFGLVRRGSGAWRQVRIRTPGGGPIEVLRVESDVPGLEVEPSDVSGTPAVVARLDADVPRGRLGGRVTVHTSQGPVVVPVSAVVE